MIFVVLFCVNYLKIVLYRCMYFVNFCSFFFSTQDVLMIIHFHTLNSNSLN